MAIKHDLQRSIQLTLRYNHDGAYATQADRSKLLMSFAKDLTKLGYGLRHIQGLKTKHIQAVIKQWQSKGLSNATIKNRTAALRYLAKKINKPNIIPSNNDLAIPARKYAAQRNRALINPDFSRIHDPYVQVTLQLQRVFGLRREEAIKIRPHQADQNSHLILQPSWCKGGRGRSVPIRTDEQRHWLEAAKKIAGSHGNSLIPPNKSYIKHRHVYDKQANRAGLRNLHGLRHAYAQARYKELTGWDAPINGGPTSKQLTPEQKKLDYQARMILSEELGHSREQILTNYCSR